MDTLTLFFEDLWQQYTAITPQALAIHQLFEGYDETDECDVLVNDHVAFRTFSHSVIDIDILESQILALGYVPLDDYYFDTKKLKARCYLHPTCPTKIFISELLWNKLSPFIQNIIKNILKQIDGSDPVPLNAGRIWAMPNYVDYQALLAESEYAAWLAVWGLRANHFTLFVNHLKHYQNLQQLVDVLKQKGYPLNTEGGDIKGTEQDLLIQAATMADKIAVIFPDVGKQMISSCYYEFAQRFVQEDGCLYQGFVPSSADKIFESTHSGSGAS